MTKGLTEAQIENTCSDWLALDGWRTLKTDPVSRREWGKGFGELGMADRLYIRYVQPDMLISGPFPGLSYWAQVLWIEWKRPRKKASQHQLDWHAAERARGGKVWVAGVDFPASIELFQEFYRTRSGLMKRGI